MLHIGKISKKFGQKLAKFSKILANFAKFWEKKTAKKSAIFDEKIEIRESPVDSKTVQKSALCRSRRELANEYLRAKVGFDTAENEPYYFVISSPREFEIEV